MGGLLLRYCSHLEWSDLLWCSTHLAGRLGNSVGSLLIVPWFIDMLDASTQGPGILFLRHWAANGGGRADHLVVSNAELSAACIIFAHLDCEKVLVGQ